jgi:hypothetical protein
MEIIKQISLLDSAIHCPSMYVGKSHLDIFQSFVIGYNYGFGNDYEWNVFEEWVIKKIYRRKHCSSGCWGLIAAKFGWKKRGMKELVRLWDKYHAGMGL